MSSYLWGVTSDRIGRRPVIVFGNVAAAGAALLLGFSKHFLLACIARLLGGLLNGTLGSLRTSLGELCDRYVTYASFTYLMLVQF